MLCILLFSLEVPKAVNEQFSFPHCITIAPCDASTYKCNKGNNVIH